MMAYQSNKEIKTNQSLTDKDVKIPFQIYTYQHIIWETWKLERKLIKYMDIVESILL